MNKSQKNSIHVWLRYHYGKATKCIAKNCPGISKNYDWALKKGKHYAKNIKNYQQMCRSCHLKYDNVMPINTGENHMNSKLNEKQVRVIKHMLKNRWFNIKQKEIANLFNVSHTVIGGIKRGLRWKHVII